MEVKRPGVFTSKHSNNEYSRVVDVGQSSSSEASSHWAVPSHLELNGTHAPFLQVNSVDWSHSSSLSSLPADHVCSMCDWCALASCREIK